MKYLIALALLFSSVLPAAAAQAERTLRWTDNSNNENGFIIEAERGNSGFYEIGRTTTPSFRLNIQRNECYRVRAFNQWGISPPSNVVCGRNFV